MAHVELTTTLDVETTRGVTTHVLRERGYAVSWENSWTGLGRRRLTKVNLILFTPRERLTVLRLYREAASWGLSADLLGGLWVESATNRLADAVTAALTEREALART
jgi:hypothetical protein